MPANQDFIYLISTSFFYDEIPEVAVRKTINEAKQLAEKYVTEYYDNCLDEDLDRQIHWYKYGNTLSCNELIFIKEISFTDDLDFLTKD